MINWNSTEELLRVTAIFKKLISIFFGIYAWEIVNTMHVEKALLLRIRQFQWPHILYFLCRYTLFFALLGLLVSHSVDSQIDCQALFAFIQWAGNTTIGASSTLLLIRTIAVWNRSLYVTIPMLLLSAGQWGLLYYSVTSVKAEWAPQFGECAVTGAAPAVLNAIYSYTMAFDFVILVVTVAGLRIMLPGGRSGRGGLWQMLFADGIAYFTLVASVNAAPAVLNLLNLNAAMNVIATIPACVVSTIAATRLFRRLQDYTNKDVYVHSSSFTGGIPSNVARNHHRPPAQGKGGFSFSAAQHKVGGASSKKAAMEHSNWETIPHFATFPPPRPRQDWERHDDGDHINLGTRHPYASAAGGEESFLTINEKKMDKDTNAYTGAGAGAELPPFLSYAPPPLSRHGAEPRRSKLDVKVEVIEMKATDSPSSSARTPSSDTTLQKHSPPSSAEDVV